MTGARLSHARRDLTHRRHRAAHERLSPKSCPRRLTRRRHRAAHDRHSPKPRSHWPGPRQAGGISGLWSSTAYAASTRLTSQSHWPDTPRRRSQVYDRAYRMPLRSGPRLGTPLASPSGYKLAVIHTVKQTYIYFRSAQRAGGGLTDETPQPTTDSTALHSIVPGGGDATAPPVSHECHLRLSCTRGPWRAA